MNPDIFRQKAEELAATGDTELGTTLADDYQVASVLIVDLTKKPIEAARIVNGLQRYITDRANGGSLSRHDVMAVQEELTRLSELLSYVDHNGEGRLN